MTKVKQTAKAVDRSPTANLKAVKNNPIQKKKNNKFAATPTGNVRLVNGKKVQNNNSKENQLNNKQKQKKEVIKDSPDSPDSNSSSPRNNDKKRSKQTLNVAKTLNSANAQSRKGKKKFVKNLVEKEEESDESFEDINEGVVLPEDNFVSQEDDDDDDDEEDEDEESHTELPNILGQSLADDTDEDDTDFDEEEEGEDADDNDSDEDEDAQLKGVKMFKGLLKQKLVSIAKNKKKNDEDDDDDNDDDEDEDDDNDDYEDDDSLDESNLETDTSLSPSQNKNKKHNVSIEEDEEEDDEDSEEDEDEDEEEGDDEDEESTPGLKDLLGNSIVDDENDKDFEGEDEDDEDIDISDEESEAEVDELEINKKTIFIGNVPKDTKKEEIKKVFKEFGPIESIRIRGAVPENMKIPKKVAAITKKINRNVNNICMLIVFKNEESASKALSLNGKKFKGNYLRVDTAENINKTPDDKKAVFLGNLPFKINYNDIWEHFEQCGEINFVRLIKDRVTGIGKGIGYVNFKNEDSVPLALELNGSTLLNREIRVKRYAQKGSDPKSKKKLRNRNKRSLSAEGGAKKSPKKIKLNDEVKTTSPVEDGKKKLKAKAKLQEDSQLSSEKKKTTFQGQKAVVGRKAKKSTLDKKKKKLAAVLTAKPKKAQKV